ncbi:MAG: hypothetical protein IPL26_07060 [Leptospiraceae bacterium]|nr:hypothetical protein [Leptospiraceae bacterium]
MELKDILPITISVIALFVTFLTVFLSLRSQLKLHVMTVISIKAKEVNSYWGTESVPDKERIRKTITSIIRTIQLIDKIQNDNQRQLCGTSEALLTYFYLELSDSIHNEFMKPEKDSKILQEKLLSEETDEGKKILCSQLETIRNHFGEIHEYYLKKDFRNVQRKEKCCQY